MKKVSVEEQKELKSAMFSQNTYEYAISEALLYQLDSGIYSRMALFQHQGKRSIIAVRDGFNLVLYSPKSQTSKIVHMSEQIVEVQRYSAMILV